MVSHASWVTPEQPATSERRSTSTTRQGCSPWPPYRARVAAPQARPLSRSPWISTTGLPEPWSSEYGWIGAEFSRPTVTHGMTVSDARHDRLRRTA